MKTLVVYDSFFGNTEKVAQAVGQRLAAEVRRVADVAEVDRQGLDLLVVGSPTRGFRASEATTKFMASLPAGALQGVRVAAFDTRMNVSAIKNPLLRGFLNLVGRYAASPIAKTLVQKGGKLTGQPAGFIVLDTEGPLLDGELERAGAWAATL